MTKELRSHPKRTQTFLAKALSGAGLAAAVGIVALAVAQGPGLAGTQPPGTASIAVIAEGR